MPFAFKIAGLAKAASLAVVTGFLAVVASSQLGLMELKVGGPIYKNIALGNELVADILPPPAYIIEPYLEATLAVQDFASLPERRKRLKELREEFDARHVYWKQQNIDPKLKDVLTKDTLEPARRFWALTENRLLPAIERGDTGAVRQVYGEATKAYQEHRLKVDEAVQLSKKMMSDFEASGASKEFYVMLVIWSVSAVVIALVVASAAGVIVGMISPIKDLEAAMSGLAKGNLGIRVPYVARRDELGDMARAVEVFQSTALEREKLEHAARQGRDMEVRRQQTMEVEVQKFRSVIASVLQALGQQTETMRRAALTLTDVAGSTSTEATSAARASSGASDSSQAVAAATEQLGASIKEISEQAHRTSSIVAEATLAAATTDKDVAALSEAAQTIGLIVETIRAVAEQTNLLALNATIEAARAGEAGKGFAVVASEVKGLAAQTAKATEDIASQISGVQVSTRAAVDALRTITSRVSEINGLTGAIAAAVEEQEAATREIAHNVTRAADESKRAADNAVKVTAAAARTKTEASSVGSATAELSTLSDSIQSAVAGFLSAIAVDLENRRRATRKAVDWCIVLTHDGRRLEARASDVSLTGLRLEGVSGMRQGDRIQVDLGEGQIDATVVWARDEFIGLRFGRPLAALPGSAAAPADHRAAA